MTRRDYIRIARAIRDAIRAAPADQRYGIALAVRRLVWELGQENGRFDRERFYAACGLEG